MLKKLLNKKLYKWLLIGFAIFFSLILILFASSFVLAYKYQNKIYPNIYIDNINLGGLDKEQAQNIVSGKFNQNYKTGFKFIYENEERIIANDDILKIEVEPMIEEAFKQGRNDNWFFNNLNLINALVKKNKIPLQYYLDQFKLLEELKKSFGIYEKEVKETELVIKVKDTETKEYEIEFIPPQSGQKIDFSQALNILEENINNFVNPDTIAIKIIEVNPIITIEKATETIEGIHKILELDNLVLNYEEKNWEITWSDFVHWLQIIKQDDSATIALNQDMVNGQLESIAQEIDQEAVEAKLQIKDNRVTEFEASKDGLALNKEETANRINDTIINQLGNKITLVVEKTEPKIKMEDINDLGIKEKIGVGWSDFSGSPQNRRHNIGVGAASLNGVLIAPGEEFSLVETLGEIDAQNGYKPELVIKGNKTIPEYGGGLCQIGTTIFRAALSSGLPITERRNHSYRVSYYEPAGTDATIYDPWPDFRFANDTENHVLIQTNVIGNELKFEIWGTSDGRKVSFEGNNETDDFTKLQPQIFNITTPGPAKEIESEELAPGERRRVETAHNGADALFYRIITKVDGTEEKETYRSHYVPWQAVYLVGVDPAKKEAEAKEEIEKQKEEAVETE